MNEPRENDLSGYGPLPPLFTEQELDQMIARSGTIQRHPGIPIEVRRAAIDLNVGLLTMKAAILGTKL